MNDRISNDEIFIELQKSRKAAYKANRNAFFAIGISLIAIIISMISSYTLLKTPVSINKSDLKALVQAQKTLNTQTEVKLDALQMKQILSAIEYNKSNQQAKVQKPATQSQELKHVELINRYFEED